MIPNAKIMFVIAHVAFFCSGTMVCMEDGRRSPSGSPAKAVAVCVQRADNAVPPAGVNMYSYDPNVQWLERRLQTQNDAATICCCEPLWCCLYTCVVSSAFGLVWLKQILD